MPQTTYQSMQAGKVLVERAQNGDVTITQGSLGVTLAAADFDAIVAGAADLKAGKDAARGQ